MRGKVARQLRQAAELDKKNKAKYNVVEHEVDGEVYQYDSINNKVNIVKRKVIKKTVECTQGEKILYKYFKARYNSDTKGELVLHQLPSTEVLHDIRKKISEDPELHRSEEGVQTDPGGGLSDTSSSI